MAYTLDQYNTLVAALASGATFVKYSDKEVHYRSLAEMQGLKREMEIDLGIVTQALKKKIGVYSKGLDGACIRGRGIRVAPAPTVPKDDSITVYVVASPDGTTMITMRNGRQILAQYPEGNLLNIPYLGNVGIFVNARIFVNNSVRQDIPYNPNTGTFDNTAGGGWHAGDFITIDFQYQG